MTCQIWIWSTERTLPPNIHLHGHRQSAVASKLLWQTTWNTRWGSRGWLLKLLKFVPPIQQEGSAKKSRTGPSLTSIDDGSCMNGRQWAWTLFVFRFIMAATKYPKIAVDKPMLPIVWKYKNAKFFLVNLELLNIPTSELHTYENHFGLWPCWRSPGCMPKFKMNAMKSRCDLDIRHAISNTTKEWEVVTNVSCKILVTSKMHLLSSRLYCMVLARC